MKCCGNRGTFIFLTLLSEHCVTATAYSEAQTVRVNLVTMTKIKIEFCNPNNIADTVSYTWQVRSTPVAYRWLERLSTAQCLGYTIDDPSRFYGFNSREQEIDIALERINEDIKNINAYKPIIDRTITDVNDQDTLNYLHHIFEEYHGQLDQQTNRFWLGAPDSAKKSLARLNINVHRCESVADGVAKKFLITYYGLPKDTLFRDIDYQYLTNTTQFGQLSILYAEIGKTLSDMYRDQDEYIGLTDMLLPYTHCSADFRVDLYNKDQAQANKETEEVWQYYLKHQEMFQKFDCQYRDPKHQPGKIPVADMIYDDQQDVIDNITARQLIKSVKIE